MFYNALVDLVIVVPSLACGTSAPQVASSRSRVLDVLVKILGLARKTLVISATVLFSGATKLLIPKSLLLIANYEKQYKCHKSFVEEERHTVARRFARHIPAAAGTGN